MRFLKELSFDTKMEWKISFSKSLSIMRKPPGIAYEFRISGAGSIVKMKTKTPGRLKVRIVP